MKCLQLLSYFAFNLWWRCIFCCSKMCVTISIILIRCNSRFAASSETNEVLSARSFNLLFQLRTDALFTLSAELIRWISMASLLSRKTFSNCSLGTFASFISSLAKSFLICGFRYFELNKINDHFELIRFFIELPVDSLQVSVVL